MREKVLSKVFLTSILLSLLCLVISVELEVFARSKEKPSIVFLLKPSPLPTYESMKFVDDACEILTKSEVVKPICVQADSIYWETPTQAAQFSKKVNADYMVYMYLSKRRGVYLYNAQLIKPVEGAKIAMYTKRFKAKPVATKKALLMFTSDLIFASSGRVTVNMIIESLPSHCDVYRDDIHLGDTGQSGFRGRYYLEKGSYKIRVGKPEYKDKADILRVKKNPTNYSQKFRLVKK